MNNIQQNKKCLVFSYLELRKAIGFLGIALPFVLWFGSLLVFHTGIQRSISFYYYTCMRDVFVGTLCVIGFFLLSYKGYERSDNIAGNLGCVFAVGLALFPTAPNGPVTSESSIIGHIHLAFAFLFFATLIYFSLFLFTKTDRNLDDLNDNSVKRKRHRNKIYRVCGYTMAVCIILIFLYYFILPDKVTSILYAYHPVFWLEALAIWAFGFSWLTKGNTILKDQG